MYDRHSTYLTFGGSIGANDDDTWQCGLRLALAPSLDGPGLPNVGDLQVLGNGPLKTWFTHADTGIAAYCRLAWVKAASLDPDGKYTADEVAADIEGTPTGAHTGLAGGPQLAGVVTLWSGSNTGRANYGRFYAPCWNGDVSLTTARVTSAWQNSLLEQSRVLLNAINSWAIDRLSASARVSIMSSVGTGQTKRALHVRVGNVKDTQQRRRRQLAESYAEAPLAT